MLKSRLTLLLAAVGLSCALAGASAAAHALSLEQEGAANDSSALAKRLSSRLPAQRREAAEELARAAAPEHRRLLEGYRVQESDARVRVAMDWALYRMGKGEALFAVVRALDSKQVEQAVAYLKQIEGPDPLYIFLNRVNGNTRIRLLEVLAADRQRRDARRDQALHRIARPRHRRRRQVRRARNHHPPRRDPRRRAEAPAPHRQRHGVRAVTATKAKGGKVKRRRGRRSDLLFLPLRLLTFPPFPPIIFRCTETSALFSNSSNARKTSPSSTRRLTLTSNSRKSTGASSRRAAPRCCSAE